MGRVVSFPVSSLKTPGQMELEQATHYALQNPTEKDELFMIALVEEEHPTVRGLLFVSVKEANTGHHDNNDCLTVFLLNGFWWIGCMYPFLHMYFGQKLYMEESIQIKNRFR